MSGYDSQNDSGDDLLELHTAQDTVATVPLPQSQKSQYATVPTQPLSLNNNVASPTPNTQIRSSSPSVQVTASSPAARRTPSSATPRPPPLAKGSLNGGVGSIMAPPGTQFQPPAQYSQTQSQSQRPNYFTDDEDSSSEASNKSADIKPSSFVRGNNAATGAPRVQESPFKQHTSQFGYQSPQKRSADDMASAYANAQKRPKVARQALPSKAQPPRPPQDLALAQIADFGFRQKVIQMRGVLPQHSVADCYYALTRNKGHYDDAVSWIVTDGAQKKSEAKKPDAIDLVSEGDDEPIPIPTMGNTRRDVGKSASITQKYAPTQSTKQQSSMPARSIQDKYASQKSPTSATTPSIEASKKPGRVLGRSKQPIEISSSPVGTPTKPHVGRQARRNIIDDDDEDEDEPDAPETDDDSGIEVDNSPVESRLLDLLNTGTLEQLADLAITTAPDVIGKVLDQRPFKNIDKVREVSVEVTQTTKNGKTRTSRRKIGDKLVDTCVEMMTGFTAVDELVIECEKLSKALAKDMKQWGMNAFGGSTTGELEITDIEAAHDSGIGTPTSTPSADGDGVATRRKLLKQPKTLSSNVKMLDHQVAGLNWLSLLWEHGLSGILADDMGLGKTLQVIAYLTYLSESKKSQGPHLVIVPGSTIENWLREFQNFSPSLRVEPYYGGINDRPGRQEDIRKDLNNIHVVVTTYDMATKPDDLKFLRKIVRPTVCVWDEAHELKNSQSKKYKSLVRIPAKQRIMLTGTPVQNNLAEMASLLAFLMPDLFASREEDLAVIFKNKAKLDTAAGAEAKADKSALLSADRIARARSMITPFILRRKKAQVMKDLPKKDSVVEYCKLEGDQAKLYHEIEDNYRAYLADKKNNKDKKEFVDEGAVGSEALKKSAGGRRTKTAVELERAKESATNSILISLRKAALHPLLFRRKYNDDKLYKIAAAYVKANPDRNPDLVLEDFTVMTDFEIHRWCIGPEAPTSCRKFALKGQPWLDESAKARRLVEILKDHAKNGHKTLVFSQWVLVMDVLESALSASDIPFFRLDGGTKMEQRQDLIDEFHRTPTDPNEEGHCSVFMLSTGAGGQGINLACADRVVIFDSGFNPHQDLQAENRAHRMGQTRDVVVTRLISEGTVEEQIYQVGQIKVKLDEQVAGGGDAMASGAATPSGEGGKGEQQGKGMVERLLAERLEREKVKGEDKMKDEDESEEKHQLSQKEEKDLAEAYMEGLKGAGLNVKK